MLDHQNILPLLGIITTCIGFPISIVAEWAGINALDCVQDPDIDPRPLVSRSFGIVRYLQCFACSVKALRVHWPTYITTNGG